jgi:hypothetical protein
MQVPACAVQSLCSFSSDINGTLKVTQVSHAIGQNSALGILSSSPTRSWRGWLGVGLAIGLAYFLAAQFGLTLAIDRKEWPRLAQRTAPSS